jgi:Holliday junction resolvase RusA-like endonuclease
MQKLTIEIPGNAIAKKNSQMAVNMGKRNMILPSKAYQKWEKMAVDHLRCPALEYTGTYPAVLTFYHYRKTLAAFDLSNMMEGIQDVFQKVGIINEDNMNHIIPAIKGLGWEKDAENPRVLVTLESYTDHLKGLK